MIFIFEDCGIDVFIMRTALPEDGETPGWSNVNCEPFDEILVNFIRQNFYAGYTSKRGWIRPSKDYYEHILNFIKTLDIEYTILSTEDKITYQIKSKYVKTLQEE